LGVTLNADSFPVGKVQFLDLHSLSFDEFLDGIPFFIVALLLPAPVLYFLRRGEKKILGGQI
jgi:hypothetical protein